MLLDFHIHSIVSGTTTIDPVDIIRISREKGLQGVAITDYETIRGALEVKRSNTFPDFHIIPGCSVQTEIGTLIGLFLSEPVLSGDSKTVIEVIHSQGGLVVLPHPFRGGRKGVSQEYLDSIDVVEVFNSHSSRYENMQAEEFAQRYHKSAVAGSDATIGQEIGMASTEVHCSSYEDIKNEILHNRTTIIQRSIVPPYYYFYSRYCRALKTRNYSQLIQNGIRGAIAYIFRVPPYFVIPDVVPDDALQRDLDRLHQYYNDWEWRYHHRVRINATLDLLNRYPIYKQDWVGEIGCGRGIYSAILGEKSENVVCVDLSERETKVAKQYIREKGMEGNVDIVRADGQHLPFKEGVFDFILCVNVLEHFPHPSAGAREINRVLRDGKKGLISMPNLISYYWMKKRIRDTMNNVMQRRKKEMDPHVRFPYWKIRALLNGAGLKIQPRGGAFFFSGGLLFGFLIHHTPSMIQFLNRVERRCKMGRVSGFYYVEAEKSSRK